MLILGCDAGSFPHQGTPRDEVWRDALRLYVAMTRGRDQVFLLYDQEPSMFIGIMGDTVVTREEPVFKKYSTAKRPAGAATQRTQVMTAALSNSTRGLDMEKNCEAWFTGDELETLKRYFARQVYRDGLTFHEWCVPRGLASITYSKFQEVPKCPKPVVDRLFAMLRAKGVIVSPSGNSDNKAVSPARIAEIRETRIEAEKHPSHTHLPGESDSYDDARGM